MKIKIEKFAKVISKNSYFILGILLVFCALLINKDLFHKKETIVSFNQEVSEDIEYCIYYTKYKNDDFSQENSVKKKFYRDTKNVKISLPTKKVEKIRFDIKENSEMVKISDVKVGNKKIEVLNLDKLDKSQDIEDIFVENNSLVIKTNGNDPYFVYKDNLNIENERVFDWKIFISLLCCYGLVLFLLLIKSNKSYLVLFFSYFILSLSTQIIKLAFMLLANRIDTNLNGYIVYFIMSLIVLYSIFILYKGKTLTPYKFFIITSMFIPLMYFILFLPFSAPDSVVHFSTSYRFSSLLLNKEKSNDWVGRAEDADFYKMMRGGNPISADYEKIAENIHLFATNDKVSEMPVKADHMKFYSIISYFPLSLGFILGRLCNLSSFFTIYLSRFLLLLCYILTISHTIKKSSVGKNIIAMTALLPMPLMMSSAFNYDGMVIISSFAFIFSVFSLDFNRTRYSLYECMFWAFVVGSVKGGGYILLLLLGLILIERDNKKSIRDVFLICLSGIFSILLFDLILVYDQHLFQFGVKNSEKMLASDAFCHPLMYMKMALNTYKAWGIGYMEHIGGTNLCWLEATIPSFVPWSMFSIIIIISIFEQTKKRVFGIKDIVIMSLIILLVLFTLPIMLLSWTPVDSQLILGLQGRYYLPVVPLAFIIISHSIRSFISDNIVLKYKDDVIPSCYILFSELSVISVLYIMNLYLTR